MDQSIHDGGVANLPLRLFDIDHARRRQRMDPDSPWEAQANLNHAPDAEWSRISSEFTNSGYREGIIAGKEAFLQPGFDDGFASVGVPLGRELGNLRGVATAIKSLFNSQDPHSTDFDELHSISSALSAITYADIVPRDAQAEQHAKEHMDFDDPTLSVAEPPQENRPTGDLSNLRERLAALSIKLGLPVLV